MELDLPGVEPTSMDKASTTAKLETRLRPAADVLEREEPEDINIRNNTTSPTKLTNRLSDPVQSPQLVDRISVRPSLYQRLQTTERPVAFRRERRHRPPNPAPEPTLGNNHPDAM